MTEKKVHWTKRHHGVTDPPLTLVDAQLRCRDQIDCAILTALAENADWETGETWTGVMSIAAEVRLSQDSVRRRLRALVKAEVIVNTGETHPNRHGKPSTIWMLPWIASPEFLARITRGSHADNRDITATSERASALDPTRPDTKKGAPRSARRAPTAVDDAHDDDHEFVNRLVSRIDPDQLDRVFATDGVGHVHATDWIAQLAQDALEAAHDNLDDVRDPYRWLGRIADGYLNSDTTDGLRGLIRRLERIASGSGAGDDADAATKPLTSDLVANTEGAQ